jgi:VWFA-related protein
VASNSGEGSHFAGGFIGFAEIARTLTSGGAVSSRPDPGAGGSTSSGALFRADARLVEVHTTVMDDRGRYLDGLAAERFTVRENGRVVSLASFEPATAAINCSLLLDTSESMDAALPAVKSAATKLIQALRPDDPVAVYTLGDSVAEIQSFTTDHAAAARAVQGTEPAGETALYDALIRVNRDLSPRPGKKVMVVFTDGQDNASTLTAAAAILRARTAGIPIYTVAQGHALNHAGLLGELAGMSRATGGLSFTIASPEEAGVVFQRIVEDLLHGYLLAFSPAAVEDRAWRPIEVQVRTAPGHTVRAREGYYPQ